MLRLLFSIVRNVISVSRHKSLGFRSFLGHVMCLESQEAPEMMSVTESLSEGTDRDFIDVTLVREDTYLRFD